MESKSFRYDSLDSIDLQKSQLINFEKIIKNERLEDVAKKLVESTFVEQHFMKKDAIDSFINFTFFKVQIGFYDVFHMAYPVKRMYDRILEERVMILINELLLPEIVLKLLMFFTRNIYNSDTNLYLANLIESETIVKAIYDTFLLFREDIFIYDNKEKCLNVKKIQQFSFESDDSLSLPLDACARLKYLLEFFLIKIKVNHIYTKEDISMTILKAS